MELMKIGEEKLHSPQRRGLRLWRSGRNQKAITSNILEKISQFSGGEMAEVDGRVRIMVKKEDLKQVLEAIRDGRRRNSAAVPFEQRLNMLLRRQILRAKGTSRASWRPALQSIPEEF